MADKRSLESAYDVKTPEETKGLYADWADSYDTTFAQKMYYQSPRLVADAYSAAGGCGNVLDVGAGTGIVGEMLVRLDLTPVHALDFSPEMLEVARRKDIYETLTEGDITARLDLADESFDGVVSAGTFTNGHVGPEGLDELLRVAKHGALFVLTIHERHYEKAGFAAKLEGLRGQIKGLITPKVRAYGDGATGEHARDQVHLTQFVKV